MKSIGGRFKKDQDIISKCAVGIAHGENMKHLLRFYAETLQDFNVAFHKRKFALKKWKKQQTAPHAWARAEMNKSVNKRLSIENVPLQNLLRRTNSPFLNRKTFTVLFCFLCVLINFISQFSSQEFTFYVFVDSSFFHPVPRLFYPQTDGNRIQRRSTGHTRHSRVKLAVTNSAENMGAPSMADIRHALFTKEPDNPDDLVEVCERCDCWFLRKANYFAIMTRRCGSLAFSWGLAVRFCRCLRSASKLTVRIASLCCSVHSFRATFWKGKSYPSTFPIAERWVPWTKVQVSPLIDWLIGWLVAWLIWFGSIDWLVDWLIDWPSIVLLSSLLDQRTGFFCSAASRCSTTSEQKSNWPNTKYFALWDDRWKAVCVSVSLCCFPDVITDTFSFFYGLFSPKSCSFAAPSYHAHQVADPLALSPMARLLMQRRAQRAEMDEAAEKEVLRETASSYGAPAIEDLTPATMYRGTEAQIKERAFLSELRQTVLFSHSRIPQILSGSVEGENSPRIVLLDIFLLYFCCFFRVLESRSVNRWAPDLAVVEEESEDTPEVPTRQLEPPVVPCRTYEAYLEQRKQDQGRNDRPKSLKIRITDSIGMACNNRFEDDRDARSQPVDFFVDWHMWVARHWIEKWPIPRIDSSLLHWCFFSFRHSNWFKGSVR